MICILSDTHENIRVLRPALEHIRSLKPELIIHCGDIVSPSMLDNFKDLPARFVYGNNDHERSALQKKCSELGFGEINDVVEIEFKNKKLLVYHGTNFGALNAHISAQHHDYVFHGHTHVPRDERIGRTRVINPGALFMAERFTFAALDIVTEKLEFHEVIKQASH